MEETFADSVTLVYKSIAQIRISFTADPVNIPTDHEMIASCCVPSGASALLFVRSSKDDSQLTVMLKSCSSQMQAILNAFCQALIGSSTPRGSALQGLVSSLSFIFNRLDNVDQEVKRMSELFNAECLVSESGQLSVHVTITHMSEHALTAASVLPTSEEKGNLQDQEHHLFQLLKTPHKKYGRRAAYHAFRVPAHMTGCAQIVLCFSIDCGYPFSAMPCAVRVVAGSLSEQVVLGIASRSTGYNRMLRICESVKALQENEESARC